MTFDSLQHVTEPAEYVGANRIALECARGDTNKAALHRRDAEMVSPELNEPLDETWLCNKRPPQPRRGLSTEDLLDCWRRF